MNKTLASLITLSLIKNCLLGAIEYYNIPQKTTIIQKQIETLETELFPKVVREKYNLFTNPSRNRQARDIKTQVASKKLAVEQGFEKYNEYIFQQLLNPTYTKDIQFLQKDPYACIIKQSILHYSVFYFSKLLGQSIDLCKENYFKFLKNAQETTTPIAPIISELLHCLKPYPESNTLRYALSNLIEEPSSCKIDFCKPNQSMFALWETLIVNVLNTLKKQNRDIYIQFVIFYNEHKENGLLLNWEAFWIKHQDDIKPLKDIIKKEKYNITKSFYTALSTMPIFSNIDSGLQLIFNKLFDLLNQSISANKKKLIDPILSDFIDGNNFSIINILFDKNILPYPAKIYVVNQIVPVYPTEMTNICDCILKTMLRTQAIGIPENPFEELMLQNSHNESKYGVEKMLEVQQKRIDQKKEDERKKEEMHRFLAEKKEQTAQQKQKAQAKKQKTLSDLDIIFGSDPSEKDLSASFQKTVITAEEYKSLLEQAHSTGNVMQHGSHATMRITLEDTKGEKRQIQLQGHAKHGKGLQKGGKGKKSYAMLEQKKDSK